MDWNDAILIARENLGYSPYGYVGSGAWEEIVFAAKEILKEEASKIATWKHKEYLNSEEWKNKKKMVLERDNYICQDCLKIIEDIFSLFNKIKFEPFKYVTKAEDVHHLDYKYKQTDLEIDYCVSLCRLHHELRHCFNSDGKKWLYDKIETNILLGIHNHIIEQPQYKEEIIRQHLDFIGSLKINPNKIKEGDLNGSNF